MGFETYLVENVNRMHTLLMRAELVPQNESACLTEAAVIGCKTLERLMGDKSFALTIKEMSAARLDEDGHTRREFSHLVDDLNTFEEFLKVEHDLLLESGLFPDIAESLINLSRKALDEVRYRAQPASEVIEAARTLKDQACKSAENLVKQNKDAEGWAGLKNRLKRIVTGIGGAALVGVNAAALVPTAATPLVVFTAAMAAVSAALGGALVQNAAFPSEAQAASATN